VRVCVWSTVWNETHSESRIGSAISTLSYDDVRAKCSLQKQVTVISQNQWAFTTCYLKACGLGSRVSIYQTNIVRPVFCSVVSVDGVRVDCW
jgi:hypothetical protein